MTAWREEKRDVERTERITVEELHKLWGSGEVQVLDVREASEWQAGHIPRAIHAPYHNIHELPAALDPSRPVAVHCASGQRAAVGASLVQRHGCERVLHVVDGGLPKWRRLGFDVDESEQHEPAS